MKLIASLVGLCVLLLGGVQAQTPDVRAAREELMKLDRQFDEAAAAHGLSGWLEFFAEDAVIFPTGGPIVRGLKAIREHYDKTGFSPEGLRWQPAGADVSSSGDLGYTYGTWELAGKGPEGKPLVLRGKYTTIWKKQADGRWKVVLDIGNNEPPRRDER